MTDSLSGIDLGANQEIGFDASLLVQVEDGCHRSCLSSWLVAVAKVADLVCHHQTLDCRLEIRLLP